MDNSFEIPVEYNGKQYLFAAELITYGYSYKIEVNVFDTLLSFEPDEERNYRAVISAGEQQHQNKVDKEILELIAASLHALFSNS